MELVLPTYKYASLFFPKKFGQKVHIIQGKMWCIVICQLYPGKSNKTEKKWEKTW